MRLFTAGLITETNTFAPWPTGRRGFSENGPFHGDATSRGKDTETGVLAALWKELAARDGVQVEQPMSGARGREGGGVAGIVMGLAVSLAVSKIFAWPVPISPTAILGGFLFAAAVGIFFGFYPARKAAALDPIEALRYE